MAQRKCKTEFWSFEFIRYENWSKILFLVKKAKAHFEFQVSKSQTSKNKVDFFNNNVPAVGEIWIWIVKVMPITGKRKGHRINCFYNVNDATRNSCMNLEV